MHGPAVGNFVALAEFMLRNQVDVSPQPVVILAGGTLRCKSIFLSSELINAWCWTLS